MSVAVMVWTPVVLKVIVNMLTPNTSVLSGGRTAAGSLLVKCTVPE
jgi:hypothetical protein